MPTPELPPIYWKTYVAAPVEEMKTISPCRRPIIIGAANRLAMYCARNVAA